VCGGGGCDGALAAGVGCAALLPGAEFDDVGVCWATSKGQSINEQAVKSSLRIPSPLGRSHEKSI
jgi:hypothetical protein